MREGEGSRALVRRVPALEEDAALRGDGLLDGLGVRQLLRHPGGPPDPPRFRAARPCPQRTRNIACPLKTTNPLLAHPHTPGGGPIRRRHPPFEKRRHTPPSDSPSGCCSFTGPWTTVALSCGNDAFPRRLGAKKCKAVPRPGNQRAHIRTLYSQAPPPPPCVTFRRVVAPLRGPGQSPVRPFARCVGSLLSVGRCGRCSCWCRFRVRGAQLSVCWGCAGCGGMCRLRVTGAPPLG